MEGARALGTQGFANISLLPLHPPTASSSLSPFFFNLSRQAAADPWTASPNSSLTPSTAQALPTSARSRPRTQLAGLAFTGALTTPTVTDPWATPPVGG